MGGDGENSCLFSYKWASLPAWVQSGLGCYKSREKARRIESERVLAVGWYLLWAWAFLCKSLFTRTLFMLFCDHLLQITAFTLNLLEKNLTFSLLLEGAHILDGNCEKVLNQTGTAATNWFKIIIGAGGRLLLCLCFAWDGDAAEEMLSGSRSSKPVPRSGCPARHPSKIHLHLRQRGLSCLLTSAADRTPICAILQVNLTQWDHREKYTKKNPKAA